MTVWYKLNIGGELKKPCNGGIRGHSTLLLSIKRYSIGSEAEPVHNIYIICGKLTQLMLHQNIV